jgi:hypothetical protein
MGTFGFAAERRRSRGGGEVDWVTCARQAMKAFMRGAMLI